MSRKQQQINNPRNRLASIRFNRATKARVLRPREIGATEGVYPRSASRDRVRTRLRAKKSSRNNARQGGQLSNAADPGSIDSTVEPLVAERRTSSFLFLFVPAPFGRARSTSPPANRRQSGCFANYGITVSLGRLSLSAGDSSGLSGRMTREKRRKIHGCTCARLVIQLRSNYWDNSASSLEFLFFNTLYTALQS